MKHTSEWQPNQVLLQWLFDRESAKKDFDGKNIFTPDGTVKGGQGRSMREVLEEMKEGTEFGRSFYGMIEDEMRRSPGEYADFKAYQDKTTKDDS